MILEISGLTKNFGGLAAVSGMNITVNDGEVLGLIGPNGAGKSTLFNLITGVIQPTKGTVVFKGKDITGKRPHVIAELGIGPYVSIKSPVPQFHGIAKCNIFIPNSGRAQTCSILFSILLYIVKMKHIFWNNHWKYYNWSDYIK